jgi:squamous cell carcinoma antigen recognized by T-cells 3
MLLSVLISNPERKKGRTDASANDREIYVAGLSRGIAEKDLKKLFSTVSMILRCVESILIECFSTGM